jgi:hypothetical protein
MITLLYDQNDGLILCRKKMLTLIEINFWLENLLFAEETRTPEKGGIS